MPDTHTYPIVGSFYRPPAKAILAVLPIGTSLHLRAEPDNHVDPNAIAVWLLVADFPERSEGAFDNEGGAYGYDTARLRESSEWHLGYIPAGLAKALRSDNIPAEGTDIIGEFTCNASGSPMIRFES